MAQDLRRFLADFRAGRTRVMVGDFPTQKIAPVRKNAAGRPRRRWYGWVIAGCLLVALASGAVWGYNRVLSYVSVPEVTVPDVRKMPADDAKQTLSLLGLEADMRFDTSTTIPAGNVIDQDPKAQTRVKKGRKVGLIVSRGVNQTKVQDVRGLTADQAVAQLQQYNLQATPHEEYNMEYPAGRVFRQEPQPLSPVAEGSTVDIWISKGPVVVPPVVGKKRAEAIDMIQKAGAMVGVITWEASVKPIDTVIGTTPTVGNQLAANAPVNLVISAGPPRADLQITVPLGSLPRSHVVVYLQDSTGVNKIFEGDNRVPGEVINLSVAWQGPHAEVSVQVNGQPTQTFSLPKQPAS